jgi:hypothetical protein
MLLDTLNRTGAEELGERIKAYWAARGYVVRIDIATEALFGNLVWVVRSDMVNGFPRRG